MSLCLSNVGLYDRPNTQSAAVAARRGASGCQRAHRMNRATPGWPQDKSAMTDQPPTPAPAQPAAASDATGDPNVSLAFVLGWQLSKLFRSELRDRSQRRPGDLPGLDSLSNDERREISVNQVQGAIIRLQPAAQRAGLTLPMDELAAVKTALTSWDERGKPAVEALHLKLLTTLIAADFRLGKGYGLGRGLSDTCRKPGGAD